MRGGRPSRCPLLLKSLEQWLSALRVLGASCALSQRIRGDFVIVEGLGIRPEAEFQLCITQQSIWASCSLAPSLKAYKAFPIFQVPKQSDRGEDRLRDESDFQVGDSMVGDSPGPRLRTLRKGFGAPLWLKATPLI